MGIEVLDRDTTNFNEHLRYLYVPLCIVFHLPRQIAGFGQSVAFNYRIPAGVYDKVALVKELLYEGYFGENNADLKLYRWCNDRLIIIELL
tara:strand:- start:318 stop:590 length:273 start_codon:yes stop_codon:yes gene_type:complete